MILKNFISSNKNLDDLNEIKSIISKRIIPWLEEEFRRNAQEAHDIALAGHQLANYMLENLDADKIAEFTNIRDWFDEIFLSMKTEIESVIES
jgi:hypothetical protein